MWPHGTRAATGRAARRGAALVVVTLLVGVLSTFAMAAVQYSITLAAERDSASTACARWLAELGAAAARAHVQRHPLGPWPHTRTLTAVADDRGAPVGEYTYSIADRTLPEQNQRRFIQVTAWCPTQSRPQAAWRLRVWMEQESDRWRTTAQGSGEYAIAP